MKFTNDFLFELIKLCFKKDDVIQICKTHLKYQYLPTEEIKKVFKAIVNYYDANGKRPSFGIISQQFQKSAECTEIISSIKKAETVDKDEMLKQLETYIKQAMFIDYYDMLGDLFNSNDKVKAYEVGLQSFQEIDGFSLLKESFELKTVFGGFEERSRNRLLRSLDPDNQTKSKIPIGIDEIDDMLQGGLSAGDIALFLAGSGVGKTKLLRWIGVSVARRGFRVLHIQAEGTEEECFVGYDSTWTSIENEIIKNPQNAKLTKESFGKLMYAAKNVRNSGGEIFVHSYEQFGAPNMKDVRDVVIKIEEEFGKIDFILLDYLELFDAGDGKRYKTDSDGERARRRSVGRKFKNICNEFQIAGATCTQSQDIKPKEKEDPKFHMTRSHLSEFKNAIEPFSLFATLNQTDDEYTNNVMRIFIDKLRNYKGKKIVKIVTNYRKDRFYNRKATIEAGFYTPITLTIEE